MEIPVNSLQNHLGYSDHKKRWWIVAYENRQNRGFAYSGSRLTLQMGHFKGGDQTAQYIRS